MNKQLLSLINRCNVFNPRLYTPLSILSHNSSTTHEIVGCVLKSNIPFLQSQMAKFIHVDNNHVILKGNTYEERTHHMTLMTDILSKESYIHHELRHEYYGKYGAFHVDRAASTFWGIPQFGTHLNGIVLNDRHQLSHVWLGRRSSNKHPFPNCWDSLVGGGLPTTTSSSNNNNIISPHSNMQKEAFEEAGIDKSICENSLTGSISYVNDEPRGLKNNTMFIYDFVCPPEFKPTNQDGEVQCFKLFSVKEVLEDLLLSNSITVKPDICLVLIDLFLRYGVLTPIAEDSKHNNYQQYISLNTKLQNQMNYNSLE